MINSTPADNACPEIQGLIEAGWYKLTPLIVDSNSSVNNSADSTLFSKAFLSISCCSLLLWLEFDNEPIKSHAKSEISLEPELIELNQ